MRNEKSGLASQGISSFLKPLHKNCQAQNGKFHLAWPVHTLQNQLLLLFFFCLSYSTMLYICYFRVFSWDLLHTLCKNILCQINLKPIVNDTFLVPNMSGIRNYSGETKFTCEPCIFLWLSLLAETISTPGALTEVTEVTRKEHLLLINCKYIIILLANHYGVPDSVNRNYIYASWKETLWQRCSF